MATTSLVGHQTALCLVIAMFFLVSGGGGEDFGVVSVYGGEEWRVCLGTGAGSVSVGRSVVLEIFFWMEMDILL